jgi:hypothetical protein
MLMKAAVPLPTAKTESLAAVEVPKVAEVPKMAPLPAEILKLAEALPPVIPEKKATTPPADLGKGGEQHKAMQRRIKEAAEALGFRSVIEKQIGESQESIDLFLERGDRKIACEISVSTTIDHEVGNVAKCLKAGLPEVTIICVS